MLRRVITWVALTLLFPLAAVAVDVDQLVSTVVFLFHDTPAKTKGAKSTRASGTGFLVTKGDKLLLVTAKHVSGFLKADSSATIQGSSGKPRTVSMSELSGWQGTLEWKTHPKADLAILRLQPTPAVLSELQGHFLADSILDPKPPSRNITLTVLGFALGIGAEGEFSPISRDTKLAGGPITDKKTSQRVLLLQDPSVGGFSGAPVFDLGRPASEGNNFVLRGGLACIGLAIGTLSDDTGGKFAAVVPASEIIELIGQF